MECRQSLFAPSDPVELRAIEADPRNNRRATNSMRSAVRSGRTRPQYSQQNQKVEPKPKKRLPLPKNMVLLSLIEASNLAKDANYNYSLSKSLSDDDIEEGKILMSTDLATSSCGTYAVAKKEGLTIVPHMNDVVSKSTRRLFGEDNLIGKSVTKKKKIFGFPTLSQQPNEMHLSYGDRIQVVTIVDHWAKLARGYGYVYFENSDDLVKVAGVLDKACNIESMLYALSFQRNHLLEHKLQMEKDAVTLMQQLQNTLAADEDLTVIGADAFTSEEIIPETRDDEELKESAVAAAAAETNEIRPGSSHSIDSLKKIRSPTNASNMAACASPPSIYTDMMDPKYLVEWFRSLYTSDNPSTGNLEPRPDVSSAMLASAASWRKRNGREASRGVDFRTGMSGHHAVQSNYSHSHSRGESSLPKMSCHSGLTPSRARRKTLSRDDDSIFNTE